MYRDGNPQFNKLDMYICTFSVREEAMLYVQFSSFFVHY